MRLTVLGSSGTYPRPGGACSGYLLQEKGTNLVLDLGNGCLSNLLRFVEVTEVHAVVITHMHVDHFADLYPLYYALRFHPQKPWGLRLILPRGGLELLGCLLGEEGRSYLPEVFAAEDLLEGNIYQVGDMELKAFPTAHPVEGYGLRVEGDSWSLAYSSDTSWLPELVEGARDADLFICEATLTDAYREEAAHGHLTSRQAGEAAALAGVKRLLVTHVWPTFDPRKILEEAAEAFAGEVELAVEGLRLELGGG